jgi:uncharacterized protein with GYD domain
MPKFLYQAGYSAEGLRGLKQDTAAGRVAAVKAAMKSMGGKLDEIYFCFGKADVMCVIELPDNATAAALSVAVGSTGLVHGTITPLLTAAELDKGLAKKANYRAPGAK